jgi:hypothetical protein
MVAITLVGIIVVMVVVYMLPNVLPVVAAVAV